MAIKLRVNQTSSLTYNEMDRNFSSFFYSASVDTSVNLLRLWYTGSTSLNISSGDNYGPRYVDVNLNPTGGATPTLFVAGANDGDIQYRQGNNLGAAGDFNYSTIGLGIGTSVAQRKIHVATGKFEKAILRLQSDNKPNLNKVSYVEFYESATPIGEIGRTKPGTDTNIYITSNQPGSGIRFNPSNTGINAMTGTGLGIGTYNPTQALHVVGNSYIEGNIGIGTTVDTNIPVNILQNTQLQSPNNTKEDIAKFKIIPIGGEDSLNITAVRTSTGTDWRSVGMRIQQQVDNSYKGYLQFSGTGNKDGISIGTGTADTDLGAAYNTVSERLRINSSGNVGIGTTTPGQRLTVSGSISGSGDLTIQGDIIGGGSININGGATIQGISEVSTSENSTLIINPQGLIQKIEAAPVPIGGIILWSGLTTNIPVGWALCDGNYGTPNLTNKFIVGANSSSIVDGSNTATTTITGTATKTGGITLYTPTGTITIDKLTAPMVPQHTHIFLGDDNIYGNNAVPTDADKNKRGDFKATIGGYDADSGNGGNRAEFYTGINQTGVRVNNIQGTTPTSPTGTFTGTAAGITPPYYALAYIMYIGS